MIVLAFVYVAKDRINIRYFRAFLEKNSLCLCNLCKLCNSAIQHVKPKGMLIRMIWQSPGLWEAGALFVKYYEELLYPFSSRLVSQTEIQDTAIA